MSNTVQPKSQKSKNRWARWTLFALTGVILSAVGVNIYAQPPGFFAAAHCRFNNEDPMATTKCADSMLRVLMSKVDASEEQQTRIKGIVSSALNDLGPLREKHRAGHKRAGLLLSQSHIDRTAFEALRVEKMQLAESASRRIMQALTDAAEVLTPEQRAALVEHMEQMHTRHSW